MRRFVGVSWGAVGLVVGLLVGTALGPTAAVPERHEHVLVFGDSITSQYTDDPGDPMQGWWSMLGQRQGWETTISAQAGGGLVKKGFGCYGTAVRERAAAVMRRVRPTVVVVALGYNDVSVCSKGRATPVNAAFRDMAAAAAFEQIGRVAEEVGMRRSDVVVTVPWGTLRRTDRARVATDYRDGAREAGLTFVNVPRFVPEQTRDLTHPNRLGSAMLADRLEAVIVRAVASRPERPDPVVDVPTPARSTATTPAPTSTPTPTTSTSPSPEAAPPTSGGSGPADVGPAPQD